MNEKKKKNCIHWQFFWHKMEILFEIFMFDLKEKLKRVLQSEEELVLCFNLYFQ